MSKAQTDIRTTSYDELAARPDGYQGSIDSVIAQIRGEGGWQSHGTRPTGRAELLMFLGVNKVASGNGPSVELDKDVRYGDDAPSAEGPSFYSLAYALKHFPGSFLHRSLLERLAALSESQQLIFRMNRVAGYDVTTSLDRAEAYPYPYPTARAID